jgi:hypothetical protein
VRVIGSLILAAVLHLAVLAQKPPDPEARNRRAVSVTPVRPATSVQTHPSAPDATSVPKSGSSSARDLAKIERTSVQRMKTTHKANNNVKTASSASPGPQPQTKNKAIKFSYHAPQAAANASAKNPPPPPVRSHP